MCPVEARIPRSCRFLFPSCRPSFQFRGCQRFPKTCSHVNFIFYCFQSIFREEDSDNQQYVSLIHASLPDDDWDSTACRFGFSLTDLHATEIFDYAIKLNAVSGFVSPLNNSVDFQRKRLQYAQLLAGFGSFNAEAFRYLLSVTGSIWYYYSCFSIAELTTIADLADR